MPLVPSIIRPSATFFTEEGLGEGRLFQLVQFLHKLDLGMPFCYFYLKLLDTLRFYLIGRKCLISFDFIGISRSRALPLLHPTCYYLILLDTT